MKHIDCLLVGFNEIDFADYIGTLRLSGTQSASYRDARLAFLEVDGQPLNAMDIVNRYANRVLQQDKPLHNSDYLWPVITYLGTYLDKHGFTFDYVNLFHFEKEKLKRILSRDEVLLAAVTTTVYVSPQPILEIVNFIHQYNPGIKIVIGGPYLSTKPRVLDKASLEELLVNLGGDFYIFDSEGEAALVELLTALKEGTPLTGIANLAYFDEGKLTVNPIAPENNPLNENMVNYSLFPHQAFGKFVSLRTARSCPFSCAFCGFPSHAGKYTYLDVQDVEKELDNIKKIGGVTNLSFIDDSFNVPAKRFKDIIRMMIKKNYGFKWNSYLRSDYVDEEVLELMVASGCEGVFLGIESGSDEILEKMNKSSRIHHYKSTIESCRDLGIITYTSIIVGFPGETHRTVRQTIDFLQEVRPDFYRAQCWYADPTTPIFLQKDEYNIGGSGFQWSHRTMDVDTAAFLVEKIMLSVRGSTWLPQNGFEFWSIFYLMRKGFTPDQLKEFLGGFQSCLKQKLLSTYKQDVREPYFHSMTSSLNLEGGKAAKYHAANEDRNDFIISEEHWRSLFRGFYPPDILSTLTLPDSAPSDRWEVIPIEVCQEITNPPIPDLKRLVQSTVLALLLTLYRAFEIKEAAFMYLEKDKNYYKVFPLVFNDIHKDNLDMLPQKIAESFSAGEIHHYNFLYLLRNQRHVENFEIQGYCFDPGIFVLDEAGEMDFTAHVPEVSDYTRIFLTIQPYPDSFLIAFHYPEGIYSKFDMSGLASGIGFFLDEILKKGDNGVGDFFKEAAKSDLPVNDSPGSDETDEFNFFQES